MEPPAAALMPQAPQAACSRPAPQRRPDPEVFERIMRLYNRRLYRLAFGLLGNAADAEDVLQDSYVRAYLHYSSVAGHASLGGWLASIVRNRAIDHLRAQQVRRAVYALESERARAADDQPHPMERVAAPAAEVNPDFAQERQDMRNALENAIALLPAPFRAVFLLREVEGLSVQQTAIFLGIPIATVKTRDHRARLLLRATLGPGFRADARATFEFLGDRCNRIVSGVLRRLTGP
jgi:RNA polymerase sigma-70 factor (ECF subfamily)